MSSFLELNHNVLKSFAVFSSILILLSCGSPQQDMPGRPNILWITCEDMSPHLGCYGDTVARTPVLDQLAREGIRYTNAFSVAGVCSPSRACLITGLYQTSFGAQHMRTLSRTAAIAQVTDLVALAIPVYEAVPPAGVSCFTEYLRVAGYYVSNNVKTDYQFHIPITAWDDCSSTAHWRNRSEDQPFFSIFNITTTHESQVWVRAGDSLLVDPSRVIVPPYYPDNPIVRKDIARHFTNIILMDRQVADILAQLEEDGLSNETIVFFYSDHGDGLPRAKRWLYDSGLRVPLIIRFPGRRFAGEVTDELVSFVDFAPTVLSLAGIDIPGYMQGQAFLGDQKAAPRDYIFAAKDRMDPSIDNARAVRDKGFKYIRNYMPEKPFVQFIPYRDQMDLMKELLEYHSEGKLEGPQKLWFRTTKPEEELYDTRLDPHEINNLAGNPEYSEVLEELRQAHLGWKSAYDPYHMVPEDELVRILWPPLGIQPQTAAVSVEKMGNRISLSCDTEGASIAYQLSGPEIMTGWLLYVSPFQIEASDTIRTVAIRIGYKQSEMTTFIN